MYRAIVYLAAGCGWRAGEVFGLEREELDLDAREVHVRRQLSVVSGRTPYLAPPKTKTSTRTNEVPTVVGDALRRHLDAYPVAGVELDDETDARRPTRRRAALVFGREDGRPIHRADWSYIWRPPSRRPVCPRASASGDLRHYFDRPDPRWRQRHDGAARHGPHHADGHAQHLRRLLARLRGSDPEPGRRSTLLYRVCTRVGPETENPRSERMCQR